MKAKFLFIILVVSSSFLIAQNKEMQKKGLRPFERIEQLEKVKLIEVLDISEETAIKFFARRNEHQKSMRDLMNKRENLLKELERDIKNKFNSDVYYNEQVSKILDIENQMAGDKERFIKSLSDIFSPEQIAKLTVFEYKFRREIAKSLMGKRAPMDHP